MAWCGWKIRERGENTKQCALREIKEETGVDESELREFIWLGN